MLRLIQVKSAKTPTLKVYKSGKFVGYVDKVTGSLGGSEEVVDSTTKEEQDKMDSRLTIISSHKETAYDLTLKVLT